MPLERHPTANGKCQAKTKAGRPCAAPVLSGSAFCSLHADPERAAALGRKGGARNRKVYDGDVHNVSVPESAGDVKRMLAETMADTRSGKIDPKLGSTLGYLGTALLRAFEVADVEQRLELNDSHSPQSYSALQRAQLAVRKLAVSARLKSLQHLLGFHVWPFFEPSQQHRPDLGEGVFPRAPPAPRLWFAPVRWPHFAGSPCRRQTADKRRNVGSHGFRSSIPA